MALLNQQFDPNQHEEMMDFSPVPDGEYMAHIDESEMKPTKNNQGQYLQIQFSIDQPGFTGRKVWTRLNLVNQHATAVKIAQRELSSICKALSIGPIQDSNVLHGKPLIIKVRVDAATANYGESNSIVAYKSAGTMGAATQQTVPGMESPESPESPQNTAAASGDQDKPAWA